MRVYHTLPRLALLLLACSSGLVHAAKKKAPKVERKELIERLVPDVTGPDDRGQYYIEHEGKKVRWQARGQVGRVAVVAG